MVQVVAVSAVMELVATAETEIEAMEMLAVLVTCGLTSLGRVDVFDDGPVPCARALAWLRQPS